MGLQENEMAERQGSSEWQWWNFVEDAYLEKSFGGQMGWNFQTKSRGK